MRRYEDMTYEIIDSFCLASDKDMNYEVIDNFCLTNDRYEQ